MTTFEIIVSSFLSSIFMFFILVFVLRLEAKKIIREEVKKGFGIK